MREIRVTIKDNRGNKFSRNWKNTDDKRNVIRWTLDSGDLPYYVDISDIVWIKVVEVEVI